MDYNNIQFMILSVPELTDTEGTYTYKEVLNILSSKEWTQTIEEE